MIRAKLSTPLCASNSGCRAVIHQADGNQNFHILENFVLSLKTPQNSSVWVDYVYVVPSDEYTPALLEESPIGNLSNNSNSSKFNQKFITINHNPSKFN